MSRSLQGQHSVLTCRVVLQIELKRGVQAAHPHWKRFYLLLPEGGDLGEIAKRIVIFMTKTNFFVILMFTMLLRSAEDFLDENILRLGGDTDWASTRLNEYRLWSRNAKL